QAARTAIVRIAREPHEALALERAQIAGERRRIHHELFGECTDADAVEHPKVGEQAELRDGEPERLDIAVVKLGDAPRRLAQPQAGAGERRGRRGLVRSHAAKIAAYAGKCKRDILVVPAERAAREPEPIATAPSMNPPLTVFMDPGSRSPDQAGSLGRGD